MITTVAEPVMTMPGPCGGTGVTQALMSAPADIDEIAEDIAVIAAVCAAGSPGVPEAAATAVSEIVFAVCSAATAASGIPRQAGLNPIKVLMLPGAGTRVPGKGCAVVSSILAAGPVGIYLPLIYGCVQTNKSYINLL